MDCGLRCQFINYYSVAFLIDSISNEYTLITIHELKPWVSFAFNQITRSSVIRRRFISAASNDKNRAIRGRLYLDEFLRLLHNKDRL